MKFSLINIILILLATNFVVTQFACNLEEPLVLGKKELDWVDTLAPRETKRLRPLLDSLCDADFDANVQKAVDSIIIIRLQEIQEILQQN